MKQTQVLRVLVTKVNRPSTKHC